MHSHDFRHEDATFGGNGQKTCYDRQVIGRLNTIAKAAPTTCTSQSTTPVHGVITETWISLCVWLCRCEAGSSAIATFAMAEFPILLLRSPATKVRISIRLCNSAASFGILVFD